MGTADTGMLRKKEREEAKWNKILPILCFFANITLAIFSFIVIKAQKEERL